MNKTIIARELLFLAKELVGMDFPTQDAYDKYMKEHPDADRSNHRVVETKKEESKKHDFSSESYFKSNPKHKDAVDAATEELRRFRDTWKKREDRDKEGEAATENIKADIEKAKKDHGLSSDKYDELPQDVRDDFEARWAAINKKYYPKGGDELDARVKEHRDRMDSIFKDAGIEGISSKHYPLTPSEYEEKMGNIHKSHHVKRMSDAIRQSPKIGKTDAVKPGDFVAIADNGTFVIRVQKVTPSGQINYVNMFDGRPGRYSKKQWDSMFESKDVFLVKESLADEVAAYVKQEFKK